MSEITVKRRGELIRKVFEILTANADGLQAKDVMKKAEETLILTAFEKSTYPKRPDVRRFEKIVRFASIPHVKAGWLVKEKGRWVLTEEGVQAFKKFTEPEEFEREAVRLYREWEATREPTQPTMAVTEEEESAPDPGTILEEAEELAWSGVEQHIQEMNPYDLQQLVAALLRAMDYHVSWVSPPGPDKGVDILAHTDPLGTRPPRIKVQVKRRVDKFSAEGLRSFMAVLGDEDVGLFVSTGGFTSEAALEARTQEKRKITLLGLQQLFDLWVQHYRKLDEESKRLLPLKPIYYLAPSE